MSVIPVNTLCEHGVLSMEGDHTAYQYIFSIEDKRFGKHVKYYDRIGERESRDD
jgi:hypothetical protein